MTRVDVRTEYRHRARASRVEDGNREVYAASLPEAGTDAETLRTRLLEAAGDPNARVLKNAPTSRVVQTTWQGVPCVIKLHRAPAGWKRYKYPRRLSRGRRAWAAANLLDSLSVPTPRPLAFFEERAGGIPAASAYCCFFDAGAVDGRTWLRRDAVRLPAAERRRVREEVLHALRTLYRLHLYHADTKAGNLLVSADPDTGQRTWRWIDLECLQPGALLTRRRLLRNLVQLNGSLGNKVSRDERMAFLETLAQDYPALRHPGIPALIERRTRVRLARERNRLVTP